MEGVWEKYWESLQYFMVGFVLDYIYVEEQINFCINGVVFVWSFNNGKVVMGCENYCLALQYFNEVV